MEEIHSQLGQLSRILSDFWRKFKLLCLILSADGLAHLHARVRRPGCRGQLQVPQHRRAPPEATHPQLQARLPAQRQDALRL